MITCEPKTHRLAKDVALDIGLAADIIPKLAEALQRRVGGADEWLTVAEKAEQLAVSRDTIVRKCAQGDFSSATDVGSKSQHCWRIKASDLSRKPERLTVEPSPRKRRYKPQLVTA
jgi:excisionase family DNA binding protein